VAEHALLSDYEVYLSQVCLSVALLTASTGAELSGPNLSRWRRTPGTHLKTLANRRT
jgi:hypothetical protein